MEQLEQTEPVGGSRPMKRTGVAPAARHRAVVPTPHPLNHQLRPTESALKQAEEAQGR